MSTRKYHRYHPGDQIGDLTLIERMPGGQKWKCRCKCGEVFVTQISKREQMRNMRNNHNITINGITMCVMDWCKQLGILKTNAYCNAKDKGITVDEYLYQRWLKKGENT